MSIPEFSDNYYLPPGEHKCTLQEVEERFGTQNEQRKRVWQSFRLFLERKRQLGLIPEEMIIDGSFCTGREFPGDVDSAILIPQDVVLNAFRNGNESEKRAIKLILEAAGPQGGTTQQLLRDLFGTHILLADSRQTLSYWADFFKRTRDPDPVKDPPWVTKPREKGILRIDLKGEVGHAERTK